jgi:hypothetical protein
MAEQVLWEGEGKLADLKQVQCVPLCGADQRQQLENKSECIAESIHNLVSLTDFRTVSCATPCILVQVFPTIYTSQQFWKYGSIFLSLSCSISLNVFMHGQNIPCLKSIPYQRYDNIGNATSVTLQVPHIPACTFRQPVTTTSK